MSCNSKCYRCFLNKKQGANYEGHKAWSPVFPSTHLSPEDFLLATDERERLLAQAAGAEPQAEPSAPALPPPKPKLTTLRRPQAETDGIQAKYPFLHAYLVVGPREGRKATMMFFHDEGRWKCCLHDRAGSRSAWSAGDTWEECLVALDRRIGDETVEWRRSWKNSN